MCGPDASIICLLRGSMDFIGTISFKGPLQDEQLRLLKLISCTRHCALMRVTKFMHTILQVTAMMEYSLSTSVTEEERQD